MLKKITTNHLWWIRTRPLKAVNFQVVNEMVIIPDLFHYVYDQIQVSILESGAVTGPEQSCCPCQTKENL
jgi:hypothetical protein